MPTQDDAEINSINARMLAQRIGASGTDWGKIFQEDTINEGDARELSQEAKKALDNLLEDPTVAPKLKEIATEATDHLIRAAELFPNPDLREIKVSGDLYLQYDERDTWFAIADRDELSYDQGGSVLLGYDDLDDLLKALRQLRARIKADETAQPEFYRQFGLYHDALERLTNNQIIMVALSLMLQEIGQNPFLNALVIQLQARGGYSPVDVTEKDEESEG